MSLEDPVEEDLTTRFVRAFSAEPQLIGPVLGELEARLRALIRSRLAGRDPDEIEDVLQEALIAVARSAPSFNPALGRIQPWAAQIASRRCHEYLERWYKRRAREVALAGGDEQGHPPMEAVDPEPEPAALVSARDELAGLRRRLALAMRALKAEQAQVIQLRHHFELAGDDLTFLTSQGGPARDEQAWDEVARLLGKEPNACQQLYRRARLTLQRELARLEDGAAQ